MWEESSQFFSSLSQKEAVNFSRHHANIRCTTHAENYSQIGLPGGDTSCLPLSCCFSNILISYYPFRSSTSQHASPIPCHKVQALADGEARDQWEVGQDEEHHQDEDCWLYPQVLLCLRHLVWQIALQHLTGIATRTSLRFSAISSRSAMASLPPPNTHPTSTRSWAMLSLSPQPVSGSDVPLTASDFPLRSPSSRGWMTWGADEERPWKVDRRPGRFEVKLIQTKINVVNTIWKEDKALQKKHGIQILKFKLHLI